MQGNGDNRHRPACINVPILVGREPAQKEEGMVVLLRFIAVPLHPGLMVMMIVVSM